MCFTAREAVCLSEQGMKDLLIGYPCWNEQDVGDIARATAEGAQITLMIDSLAHVEQIESVARRYGVRLPLCLDMDASLLLPSLADRKCVPRKSALSCGGCVVMDRRGQGQVAVPTELRL